MRVGLFGGSFNPIHKGHIALAETMMKQLSLDRVILIPNGESPYKSSEDYVSATERLQMCRLAVDNDPRFEVSSFETDRKGKSYSIYTAEYFRKKYPDDEFYWLMGSDMLLSFDKWYRYKDILKLVNIAAVTRTGCDSIQLMHVADTLKEYGNIIVAHHQPLVISSTEIRKMIKNNEDLSCYLNEKVVQYIKMNFLYTSESF